MRSLLLGILAAAIALGQSDDQNIVTLIPGTNSAGAPVSGGQLRFLDLEVPPGFSGIRGPASVNELTIVSATAANPMVLTLSAAPPVAVSPGAIITIVGATGTGCSGMNGSQAVSGATGLTVTITFNGSACSYTASSGSMRGDWVWNWLAGPDSVGCVQSDGSQNLFIGNCTLTGASLIIVSATAANPMVLTLSATPPPSVVTGAQVTITGALGTGCSGMNATQTVSGVTGMTVTISYNGTGCTYTASTGILTVLGANYWSLSGANLSPSGVYNIVPNGSTTVGTGTNYFTTGFFGTVQIEAGSVMFDSSFIQVGHINYDSATGGIAVATPLNVPLFEFGVFPYGAVDNYSYLPLVPSVTNTYSLGCATCGASSGPLYWSNVYATALTVGSGGCTGCGGTSYWNLVSPSELAPSGAYDILPFSSGAQNLGTGATYFGVGFFGTVQIEAGSVMFDSSFIQVGHINYDSATGGIAVATPLNVPLFEFGVFPYGAVDNYSYLPLVPSATNTYSLGCATCGASSGPLYWSNVYATALTVGSGGCTGCGGGFWTASGTNIYNSNTGDVGIGTTTPGAGACGACAYPLVVEKDWNGGTYMTTINGTSGTTASANMQVVNDLGTSAYLGMYSSGSTAAGLYQPNNAYFFTRATGFALGVDNATGVLKFAAGGLNEGLRLTAASNVMIGPITTGMWADNGYKLQVDGASYLGQGAYLPNNIFDYGIDTGGTVRAILGLDGIDNVEIGTRTSVATSGHGWLDFWADGVEFLALTNAGELQPVTDGSPSLGDATHNFGSIYSYDLTLDSNSGLGTIATLGVESQNANGFYVNVRAATANTATWTLALPPNGGTAGYLLSTNGSGVTSWAAPGCPTCLTTAGGQTISAAETFSNGLTVGTGGVFNISSTGLVTSDSSLYGQDVAVSTSPAVGIAGGYGAMYYAGTGLNYGFWNASTAAWNTVNLAAACPTCLTTAGGQTISAAETFSNGLTVGTGGVFNISSTGLVTSDSSLYGQDVAVSTSPAVGIAGGYGAMYYAGTGLNYGFWNASTAAWNTVNLAAACPTCLTTAGGQTISAAETFSNGLTVGTGGVFNISSTGLVTSDSSLYGQDVAVSTSPAVGIAGGYGAMYYAGSGLNYGFWNASTVAWNTINLGNLASLSGATFTGAVAHNAGLSTSSGTNSTLYIGSGGNFYDRTFTGGAPGCGGVTDGWMGFNTTNQELYFCVGGTEYHTAALTTP